MTTVGFKLKEARLLHKFTLEEVAKATKIRKEFLDAIEKGDYKALPSSTYVQGFVKNYVDFLGLPRKEYLALFRREFDEQEYLGVLPESFTKGDRPLRKFRIRPAFFLGFGIFLILLGYLFFQYRAAFFPPLLTIDYPPQNTTTTSQILVVRGSTDPNSIVTVNNLPAYVDSTGAFRKELTVFPGTTQIIIKAVNSFGKVNSVTRNVVVKINQY